MTTEPVTIFKTDTEAEQLRQNDTDGIYIVEEKFGGYIISVCDSHGFLIFYL